MNVGIKMGRPKKQNVIDTRESEVLTNPIYDKNMTVITDLLNNAEVQVEAPVIINPEMTNKESIIVSPEQNPTPKRIDPEWHDYVMSHFVEDELIDGKPNAAGLRRVFEKLMGPILLVDINVIQTPTPENNNHAVVSAKIEYYSIQNAMGRIIVSDVADVYQGNTAEPFYRHSTATAATIAESRCYRKELRLRTISSEESNVPKGEQAEIQNIIENAPQIATPAQKNAIEKLCQVTGIKNIDKLISIVLGPDPVKTMGTISEDEAKVILRTLNKYQSGPKKGGEVIPSELFE